MSCQCPPIKKRNYYRYYDTPDGCDVLKKIFVTSKYGAIAGLFLSTYDVLMYSRAVGLGPMLGRYEFFKSINCFQNSGNTILYNWIVLHGLRLLKTATVLIGYAYHTVPLTLAGATFAAVANGVQHYRNKDDSLNYFLGGLACGPILLFYFGSYRAVLLGGIALGVAGMVKKDSIDSGRVLFPHVSGNMGRVDSWRNDYTLVPDPRDTSHHTCGKK